MSEQPDVYREYGEQAGRSLLASLQALPVDKPRPGVHLPLLRVQIAVVEHTVDLGLADVDPVNLSDLAAITARRAAGLRAKHQLAGTPRLRLVGEGA